MQEILNLMRQHQTFIQGHSFLTAIRFSVSQSVQVPPNLQETVSQSASFPSKTSESTETYSSGREMVTAQQPNISNLEPVELHSPKTVLDMGIQTGSNVFVPTLLSHSMMPE